MCKFGDETCDLACKKFPICSYYAIQGQISEIQSQIGFIYKLLAEYLNEEKHNDITKEIESDPDEKIKQEDALRNFL